jgi:hypothetical protein
MVKKIRLELDLRYIAGQSDPAAGYFEEGVPDPEFLNELAVWVDEEEQFDFEVDGFKRSGKMQVFFAGSRRSFFELGRYFIAMSKFSAENSKYHDHLDGLMEVDGRAPVEMIVRLPSGPVD